jgi:hypothetical protein
LGEVDITGQCIAMESRRSTWGDFSFYVMVWKTELPSIIEGKKSLEYQEELNCRDFLIIEGT